jgi:hypothetical protein
VSRKDFFLTRAVIIGLSSRIQYFRIGRYIAIQLPSMELLAQSHGKSVAEIGPCDPKARAG